MAIVYGQNSLGDKTPSSNTFTAEFRNYAKHMLEEWKVPGLSISIIDHDKISTEVKAKFSPLRFYPDKASSGRNHGRMDTPK